MQSKLVIAGAAFGALALGALAACGPSGETADDPPVLFQWQDYVEAPFLAEYQATFKDQPQTAIYADEDEAFAKMRAGYKPDVMGPCAYEFTRWQDAGLITPIYTCKPKNIGEIAPA